MSAYRDPWHVRAFYTVVGWLFDDMHGRDTRGD